MTSIQKRMYTLYKELKALEVPNYLLTELESISNDMGKLTSDSYLPDDLVDSMDRYGIQLNLLGKRKSVLQDFKISYAPDELPTITLRYIIMNDKVIK